MSKTTKTMQQNYSIWCLGIQYSEMDTNSSCKSEEVKSRQMELLVIPRKTKTTLYIMLLRIESAIHDRFRSHNIGMPRNLRGGKAQFSAMPARPDLDYKKP